MSTIFAIDVLGMHDDDNDKVYGDDGNDVVVACVEVEQCCMSRVSAPPQSVSKESLIASRLKSNFGFPCLY